MARPVLISAPYFLPALDRYRPVLERNDIEPRPVEVVQALSEAELLPLVADVEGIICGDDEITAAVMAAAPRLRAIAKWGTGIDSIDREAAAERGIPVLNTPGAFNEPVADTVLGYMLCFARALPWLDSDIRAGRWMKRPGFSLAESTVGLVGCGNIGRAVAARARAFGARVVGCDTFEAARERARSDGIAVVSMDELLSEADFVTLHVVLDESTFKLIGAPELEAMKQSSYLINTARGRLVDEQALIEALSEGRIAGAALDVFEQEPLPAESPLLALDNCLLGPHNANASPAAWERVHESTVQQLVREFA